MSFWVFFCGIGILFLFFGGCKSPPAPVGRDSSVWSLLEKGETEKAREFFLGEVDVNSTDQWGRTPLVIAAELQDPDLAAFFITLGAVVDTQDRLGRTPLGITSENLDGDTARLLAAAGADIHQSVPDGPSPAHRALLYPAYLQAILTAETVLAQDAGGRTLLHLAAETGAAGVIESILEAGAPLDRQDHEGRTALDLALDNPQSRDHIEGARRLILAGASSEHPIFSFLAPAVRGSNYNTRTAEGLTPLHLAAREGSVGLINFLIEKKADINSKEPSGATALHEAARAGKADALEALIAAGADVNALDARGDSALHLAVALESPPRELSLLLSHGANPDLRDEQGNSPLHRAVILNGTEEVLLALLRQGADVSLPNNEGKTPLHLAVQEGRAAHISLLVGFHANILAADKAGMSPFEAALRGSRAAFPALITAETVLQRDGEGNTPLHLAVSFGGNEQAVGFILNQGAPVNAQNKTGDTSLHLAIGQNRQAVGELLLSRGADLFTPNFRGESPLSLVFHSPGGIREWVLTPPVLYARDNLGNSILHHGVRWELDAAISLIVQRGISPETPNTAGETPLFDAVRIDSPSAIRALLEAGASISTRDYLGNTPLHAAVKGNARRALEALIDSGADLNAQALNGKTPLHDAVRLGFLEPAELLIRRRAGLERRDVEGNTPLMEAVLAGQGGTVALLSRAGADPAPRNIRGDTPLHAAVSAERSDLIKLLLNRGAPIHAKNASGRTPYQTALALSPRMVLTLLTPDRVSAADDEGQSPLHIALQSGASLSIIQQIIEQGCRVSEVDSGGRSPLRVALDLDALDKAEYLTRAGSDVFSGARDGKTPAGIALSRGQDAVWALFCNEGAIRARDAGGNTILHHAVLSGRADMVSLLIALGADKNSRNLSAETPADVALRQNRMDLVQLFQ
jgi:ankyrin repeat protein